MTELHRRKACQALGECDAVFNSLNAPFFVKKNLLKFITSLLFSVLLLSSKGLLMAEDAPPSGGNASAGGSVSPSSAPSSLQSDSGTVPVQQTTPSDTSIQVDAPSVTLPTPPLPQPAPIPTATPEATPQAQPQLLPLPSERPAFAPPTAQSLNLPSAQAPGNSAPASAALPNMASLSSANSSSGGGLGAFFGWAKKLRFQAAVRTGYDSNVNSVHTNVVGSFFANLNGGVNYRFGDPRLIVNATLTGGLTSYPNLTNNNLQGHLGLGLNVEYRVRPRLILTFDSSTSYQEQNNPAQTGSGNNSSSPYVYSANSLAASYQVSDLWTSVTRVNFTANYYFQNSQNNQQGFNQPGLTQSFRYLYKPSTTLVADYNTNLYGYGTSSNSSWGQSLDVGFDHIFNPKFFWNFRGGAEYRTYQNSISGSGTYVGPYVDSNFSWAFGKTSNISWVTHVGTQPSGQQNVSYAAALRSGLNYTQGIFSRLKMNIGLAYLLTNYQNNPVGTNGAIISYNQTNLQGNIDLNYQINRIFDVSLGYQYMASYSPPVPSQEYNRGISYIQFRAGF